MIRTLSLFITMLFLTFGLGFGAETWKTVAKWPSPSNFINGVGWDGRYLWHGDGRGPYPAFYKIDPKSGRTLATIHSNFQDPGGLTFLNGGLWVTEENKISGSHWVKAISPKDGTLLKQVSFDIPSTIPDGQCEAVTTDGKLLYITFNGRWILTVDPASGKLVKILEVPWACPQKVNPGESADYYLDGVTWFFGHLFAVTNTPVAISEFDPETGKKLAEFRAPAGRGIGPEGLTTDGSSLYYGDNSDQTVYKILLIDGYFR
jgi:hypothetical protein